MSTPIILACYKQNEAVSIKKVRGKLTLKSETFTSQDIAQRFYERQEDKN